MISVSVLVGLILVSAVVGYLARNPSLAMMACCGLVWANLFSSMSPSHQAMLLFIFCSAAITVLVFAATTYIHAAMRWFDVNHWTIVIGSSVTVIFGIIGMAIMPAFFVLVLYPIIEFSPFEYQQSWVNVIDNSRTHGTNAALILAIASSIALLPPLYFFWKGLANLIARATPMMTRLVKDLKNSGHLMTDHELHRMLRPHRQAYGLGYFLATGLILTIWLTAINWLTGLYTITQ